MAEIEVSEMEYLRHGDKAYVARVYRPTGTGPFPAVIDAHGGAWVGGDRFVNEPIDRAVAAGGVVVVAPEFRNPPDATYPGSVADINYAYRWLKANASIHWESALIVYAVCLKRASGQVLSV